MKLKSLQITTIDLTAYCFLRTWFKFLNDKGFDVTLATTVEQFKDEIEETGAKVVHIPISRRVSPISDLISLYRLYTFIKREKFHSVQTYTTKAGFLGRLAAKLAGVPVIIHNILEPPHNSAKNPILKAIYIWAERIASSWADHIITTTQPNVREILDKKLVPKEKLTAIPEGLVIEKYDNVVVDPSQKREELGIPKDSIFILTVARLEPPKGHKYLLKAAEIILSKGIDAYFVCVGKGKLKSSLEKMAQRLGISHRVKFTGFRYDMLEILKSCDLFVLPSLWEGQGVVLMEAMAMKKPLVASKVGGVVDVVEDGKTGILVPPRNPNILAEAIEMLLSKPKLMKDMGEAGYKRIKEYFDDAQFNKRRYEVYRMLYKRKLGIDIP